MNAHQRQANEVMSQIDIDSKALRRLKNREGETFDAWAEKHQEERRRYEKDILLGYPPPEQAAASSQTWEGWLAYCKQQSAVARAFHKRSLAVCRAILAKRGVRATEAEAEARTWEQHEEVERWEALSETIQEWLWEARGSEKAFARNGSSRHS